ncbi:hypothetical protein GUJ93_ZPchr0003g18024 [Zizania palustris]|uniref:Uncharacterized protein n=1 Tax=Zizania palustris TaxID=103762 RepID=A0A8J5SJW2_ZIZPA|nr:hypothetical protein GUJ93_ZPchr0003g18024 [Zizania palustris]
MRYLHRDFNAFRETFNQWMDDPQRQHDQDLGKVLLAGTSHVRSQGSPRHGMPMLASADPPLSSHANDSASSVADSPKSPPQFSDCLVSSPSMASPSSTLDEGIKVLNDPLDKVHALQVTNFEKVQEDCVLNQT